MGLKGLNSGLVQDVPSELRLGFVDLDFEFSTVCPTLLGQMGVWQKQLGSWARWWRTEIKVNPTPGLSSLGTPCTGIAKKVGLKLHYPKSWPQGRVHKTNDKPF